jgi:hypothetical protein
MKVNFYKEMRLAMLYLRISGIVNHPDIYRTVKVKMINKLVRDFKIKTYTL